LHAELLDAPRRSVESARLKTLKDPDARENYAVVLAWRDRLLAAESLEAAYLGLFLQPGSVPVPPLFVDQLAQILIRHVLDGTGEPLRFRAAELWFREQSVTINDGHILAADKETVETQATTGGFGELGRLVSTAQTPLRTVNLDVISESNSSEYWSRAERHDMVLNLNFAGAGLDALCRVLEAWVLHMLGVGVRIEPVQKISDPNWVWHIGLDSEASRLLDDLWHGHEGGEARLARLLSLFRLSFDDPSVMPPSIAGRPVYLALMMKPDKTLRLKPQNLLVNLPLATQA
jgi:hypothetical protein